MITLPVLTERIGQDFGIGGLNFFREVEISNSRPFDMRMISVLFHASVSVGAVTEDEDLEGLSVLPAANVGLAQQGNRNNYTLLEVVEDFITWSSQNKSIRF